MTAEGSAPRFLARSLAAATALILVALGLFAGMLRCPLALVFHVPCPACGSTRAARALFALDVGGALAANPIAPIAIVLLGMLAARGVWVTYRYGSVGALGDGAIGRTLVRLLLVAIALEIGVWVLRFFGLFGGPVAV